MRGTGTWRGTWMLQGLILTGLGTLHPQPAQAQAGAGESIYEPIWRLGEWYRDDTNPVVQSILFKGRFQQDYAVVNADQGSEREWNVRRLRLGVRAGVLRQLTVHAEVDLNPQEADPLYVRFTDLNIEWSRAGGTTVTLGKQGVSFTTDGSTSSNELLTPERNNLSNNLWFSQEYMPGVSLSVERSRWAYQVGAFSSGRRNRELGDFSGGVFGIASLGYDAAEVLEMEEASVWASYLYQSPDSDNTFTRALRHVGSLNARLEAGRWGARGDMSVGFGYLGQSDLWGVVVMPYFDLTTGLQLVGRYALVRSDDANGVRVPSYENRVVSGRGDRYQDVYIGANRYFFGHSLKLQTGLQRADMRDRLDDGGTYSGVSWITGLRVSW